MSFALPLRPSRTTRPVRSSKQLLQPPESPHRRPSLAARGGVVKRRKSSVTSFNVPALSFFEDMFGDEFPEAFQNTNGGERKRWATILDLPAELLGMTCSHLTQKDIKRLRLSNAQLAAKVELRFDRVFISPNRANLQVLLCILDHPRYRFCVEEIVWDNSLLEEILTLEGFEDIIRQQEQEATDKMLRSIRNLLPDENMEDCYDRNSASPESPHLHNGQLSDDTKMRLLRIDNQESRDLIAKNAATMGMKESYILYQKLYQDEQEIMKRSWDVTAFHRALAEFPNLNRITLTSEIWGCADWPLPYDTPFSRALPPGFRKPQVWPWQEGRAGRKGSQEQTVTGPGRQRLPFEWRTYSVAMATLVKFPHPGIEAIDIDSGGFGVGVSSQLFAAPNGDYETTVEACRALPLKRLSLAINEDGAKLIDSSLLKNLFSVMSHLEYLDFSFRQWQPVAYELKPDDVFPTDLLRKLTHFTLSNVENLADPYGLITSLENAESIALSNVGFRESYYGLLHRLREHYSTKTCRPQFLIMDPHAAPILPHLHRAFVVDKEIDDFLYRNGPCPWAHNNEGGGLGCGAPI